MQVGFVLLDKRGLITAPLNVCKHFHLFSFSEPKIFSRWRLNFVRIWSGSQLPLRHDLGRHSDFLGLIHFAPVAGGVSPLQNVTIFAAARCRRLSNLKHLGHVVFGL